MPKVVYTLRAYIKSFTDPDKKYAVKKKQDGTFTCECLDWRFRRSQNADGMCKHLRAILKDGDNLEKLFLHGDRYVLDIDGLKWEVTKDEEVK
jgi:hypothetical protein